MSQTFVPIGRKPADEKPFETHTDPVCKMLVRAETAAGEYEYNGVTYYFCNIGCHEKFAADPEKFLLSSPPYKGGVAAASADGVVLSHDASLSLGDDSNDQIEYTCPMHPEMRQIGPGTCPKCGMALEPMVISLDATPDPEYADMKRRFWISAVLTLPVFLLAMSEMFPAVHTVVSPRASIWIQFVLATPVVLWGGFPFFERAVAIGQKSQPKHVHAHRYRHGSGVFAELGRAVLLKSVSGGDARRSHGNGSWIFRICSSDHDSGFARTGSGAACQIANLVGDQGTASPRAGKCNRRSSTTAAKKLLT